MSQSADPRSSSNSVPERSKRECRRRIRSVHQPLVRTAIKQNTAFVLMAIDRKKPVIEDVYTAIKRDLSPVRYQRVPGRRNRTSRPNYVGNPARNIIVRILIADLSYERPNVYYEIGFAHALNKRPILFRRAGTRLHFDLSVHNVPEYVNVTALRELLSRRLESILGRTPKAT